MKDVYAYYTSLDGTCGVNLAYNFQLQKAKADRYGYRYGPDCLIKDMESGGAGFVCAGFVDTPECEAAYHALCLKGKLILQTEPRKNYNSGRKFFFAVFDCGPESGKDDDYEEEFDNEERETW